jgi:hypothetical protein
MLPPKKITAPASNKMRKNKRRIGPIELERIQTMYLKCASTREMGKVLGCSHTTIGYHLNRTIKPEIKNYLASNKNMDLARVDNLERMAFKDMQNGDTEARKFIQWAIDYRAKIGGYYTKTKNDTGGLENIRVAGIPLAEFTADSVPKFLEILKNAFELQKNRT